MRESNQSRTGRPLFAIKTRTSVRVDVPLETVERRARQRQCAQLSDFWQQCPSSGECTLVKQNPGCLCLCLSHAKSKWAVWQWPWHATKKVPADLHMKSVVPV